MDVRESRNPWLDLPLRLWRTPGTNQLWVCPAYVDGDGDDYPWMYVNDLMTARPCTITHSLVQTVQQVPDEGPASPDQQAAPVQSSARLRRTPGWTPGTNQPRPRPANAVAVGDYYPRMHPNDPMTARGTPCTTTWPTVTWHSLEQTVQPVPDEVSASPDQQAADNPVPLPEPLPQAGPEQFPVGPVGPTQMPAVPKALADQVGVLDIPGFRYSHEAHQKALVESRK